MTTAAVVDTGAPYLVLDPMLALVAGVSPDSALSRMNLLVRGNRTAGHLHRLNVIVKANKGTEIIVDATTFIPEMSTGVWDLPSFLGWTGFLERFRFAVDPLDEVFYFGEHP
jgi:hypothetical protein